jgi:NAD(P)-dependent dehydrogenase (short-subunit alcohol dehydrogenase family)
MTGLDDRVTANGRRYVVTGASAGIGEATAVALGRSGGHVTVVGRNVERLDAVVAEIVRAGGSGAAEACDFSHLADVRALADRLLASPEPIHVLVNNAGQAVQHRELTADGYESTFAVNHLAPYLLTRLLLDRILASTPSRIVTVSSDAARWGELDAEDLMWSTRRYRPMKVYGTSKLANALFSLELARRTAGTGLTSNALHPGFVSTSLGRDNVVANLFLKAIRPFIRSPAKGAETSIYLASSDDVAGKTGLFWFNCTPMTMSAQCEDTDLAHWLWQVSADLVGLPVD